MAPGIWRAQLWVMAVVAVMLSGAAVVTIAAWMAAVVWPVVMLATLPRVVTGLIGR